MCCNSPLQLGALTSESFSERIVSVANLLVDDHRLHSNDEMINKLIALRMDKKFMNRIHSKNSISTMQFDNIESNERPKVQFVVVVFFSYFYYCLLLLFFVCQ